MYEISALIGAGGMGEVYRAFDTELKRQVAVKVLPDALMRDPDRRARLQREAECLAALNHPNVAHIYGVIAAGAQRALVMELVEGQTLADRIAGRPLPVHDALVMAMQIADALGAAHAEGIIHRDLKPSNVKMRPDGAVKVLDFGLAKTTEAVGSSAVPADAPTATAAPATRVGEVMGTFAYMSPEQARGEAVDQRTDVWALGCVMFEMLTGRVAHDEPDWKLLPRDLPAAVGRLLRRCLEKDVKRRMHAIADVRIVIEDALQSDAASAPPVTALKRVTPWAVAVVAIGVAVVLGWRSPDPPAPAVSRLDIVTPPTYDYVSFMLSPDGQSLAFVALDQGVPHLWLRRLDDTTPQRLSGTEGAAHPFWSPDSQSIGFFSSGLLKRFNLDGGPVQVIAQARNGLGGSWSGDTIIYAPHGGGPLLRIEARGGGVPVPATRLTGAEVTHRFPNFLPDGRHFMFRAGATTPQEEGIKVGSLDTPDQHQFITAGETGPAYAAPGFLLTLRDGHLVAIPFDAQRRVLTGEPITVARDIAREQTHGAFSVSESGLIAYRTLIGNKLEAAPVWVDREGQIGSVLPIAGTFPTLTSDGRFAAIVQQSSGLTQSNTDIWIVDTAKSVPRRFTFDAGFDINPVWSRDGSRIAFASNRHGAFDLFEKPAAATSEERPLLQNRTNKFPNDWSPDDKLLLFMSESATTGDDLWTMPVDDPSKAEPFVEGPFSENQSQFSPDGRWVAYRSNETGRLEVYVRPFPGPGSQQLISRGGGIQPRWRNDGKELYYIAADNHLMAVPIRLPTTSNQLLEVGTPTRLFRAQLANSANQQYGYAVDPKGQRFLVTFGDDQIRSAPITLMQNWFTAKTK